MKPRLLDLFCCAGGAAMGYHRAGFDVTGVDIEPQPRYPFTFIQGDALEYAEAHGHEFDAIHASPPCQASTTLKVMWNARKHEDLIPQSREILEQICKPYVIENVPGSVIGELNCAFYLCGSMFGLGVRVYDGWRQLRRHRWFESTIRPLVPVCQHSGTTIGFYGDHARDRRRKQGVRDRAVDFPDADKLDLGRAAMQMPWSDWHGISQAIPPAYTEFIGRELMRHIRAEVAPTKRGAIDGAEIHVA